MDLLYCESLHPKIVKIYLVIGTITALIWVLFFLDILQLGIVGYFLLVIFTVLLLISAFSNRSGGPGTDQEDQTDIDTHI